MSRSKGKISPNLNAFLDAIAWAEGTSTSPITLDDGYDIVVSGISGPERFDDYLTHPFSTGRLSKKINDKGLTSNACGRYQFMLKDYRHYKELLDLKDFSPELQDKWAIQLIRERRALPSIETGDIRRAVDLVNNLWASLPGAGYGQLERSMNRFIEVYLSKGGSLWESNFTQSSVQSQPLSVPSLPEISKEKPKPLPMPEYVKPNVWQKLMLMLRKLKF